MMQTEQEKEMEAIARRIAVENGMPESMWELFMFDASKEFVANVMDATEEDD